MNEGDMVQPLDFWLPVKRGLLERCPYWGKGRLFSGYLKLVSSCAACGEGFNHIRADDAPAWLTILVVGHIFAPILLFVVPQNTWPDRVRMIVWPGFAFILALVLLPRFKGLFIAMIWRTQPAAAQKEE